MHDRKTTPAGNSSPIRVTTASAGHHACFWNTMFCTTEWMDEFSQCAV
jgi:hypothetical protein